MTNKTIHPQIFIQQWLSMGSFIYIYICETKSTNTQHNLFKKREEIKENQSRV